MAVAVSVVAGAVSANAPVGGPWSLLDWEAIRDLSLGEMNWTEGARKTIRHTHRGGQAAGVSSTVHVVHGTISVGAFSTLDASFTPRTIRSIPANCTLAWPADTSLAAEVAVIGAPLADSIAVHLAADLGMPFAACTFDQAIVPNLFGFRGMNELNAMSFAAMMFHCPASGPVCGADDLKWGNFEYLLARKAMLTITLMQHMTNILNSNVSSVALYGSSKNGASTWMAASSDPRITVIAPEHDQAQNLTAYISALTTSWGCEFACDRGSAGTGHNVSVLQEFQAWVAESTSGQRAANVIDPSRFFWADDAPATPHFVQLAGDVGMYVMRHALGVCVCVCVETETEREREREREKEGPAEGHSIPFTAWHS